ncbi:hypothetical protein BU16DRAFT_586294 [Lophium mytilinum]|uniref:Uncharacterized protein n=1 Tax=Lophium mytilinum TaxID=390894 RepID=A0A6A6QAS3_9PEZI|nr:hypothetical protein BU16DRAFT_586294 [Lophium mytilinum]
MAAFLELPRELRDMIYYAALTNELPRPSVSDDRLQMWKVHEVTTHSEQPGEVGNSYTLDGVPDTCSTFLRCNHQMREEMGHVITRAKSRREMPLKLDCLVEDERNIYVTWLSFPLVRTHVERPRFWKPTTYTHLHHLQVDVRLTGNRKRKWASPWIIGKPPGRIAWGICAALKRIIEYGPDFSSDKKSSRTFMVDELVLNVVTPSEVPRDGFLPEDMDASQIEDGLVHPKAVLRELNAVWNYIWAPRHEVAAAHWLLIERIGRVRVCMDGETWRTRELQLELKRGQDERRRIALRGR